MTCHIMCKIDPLFQHRNAPIHYAITHCKLPPSITIKMLIEKGADINLQDDVSNFNLWVPNKPITHFHPRTFG